LIPGIGLAEEKLVVNEKGIWLGNVFMAPETELFFLVVLVLMALIFHLIITSTGPKRNGKSSH
jgi:hypothetical protein